MLFVLLFHRFAPYSQCLLPSYIISIFQLALIGNKCLFSISPSLYMFMYVCVYEFCELRWNSSNHQPERVFFTGFLILTRVPTILAIKPNRTVYLYGVYITDNSISLDDKWKIVINDRLYTCIWVSVLVPLFRSSLLYWQCLCVFLYSVSFAYFFFFSSLFSGFHEYVCLVEFFRKL